jgi:hypothetical protein
MKKLLPFLLLLTFSASFYSQVKPIPNSKTKVRWIPATYRGLKLGKSTYNDVKKLFGKPRWEGGNEETTFESDSDFEVLLQYSYQGIGKESADLVIGKKSRIVKAISYLPNPELSRQEAVSKFGSDYFEISAGESTCIKGNPKRGSSKKKLNYPRMLVFPEKGMYVLIGDDSKVLHVGYLYKCE